MLSSAEVRHGGLCVKSLIIIVGVMTDSLVGNRLKIRITNRKVEEFSSFLTAFFSQKTAF
jgi:hypothetical protein